MPGCIQGSRLRRKRNRSGKSPCPTRIKKTPGLEKGRKPGPGAGRMRANQQELFGGKNAREMISVLFAARNSIYKTIPGLDVWDEDRDALKWPGGNPGIFHPPCRLFSQIAYLAKSAPQEEKQLGYWSVDAVRKNGGVLEQPANSSLWRECEIAMPGSSDGDGFSISVPQFWFGHKARKNT